MARLAYFTDLPTGETLVWCDERVKIGEDRMGCARYREVPAKVGYRNGVLCGYHEAHGWLPVGRTVEMKSSPSLHDCDARCFNATGRVMKCECSCGGKNHGRGAFMCEAA